MTTSRLSTMTTFVTHGLSQAPHLMGHFICLGAPKAENEALADIGTGVSGGKGPQPKTFLCGTGRNLPVGQTWWKRNDQVHTGFRAQDLYLAAELFPECLR